MFLNQILHRIWNQFRVNQYKESGFSCSVYEVKYIFIDFEILTIGDEKSSPFCST